MVSWPPWRADRVTCIACGTSLPRADAREYDKHGDRWDRGEKEFEHLCKPCDRELSRYPRGELEEVLRDIGETGEMSQAEFCARYLAAIDDRGRELEGRGQRER